MREDSTSQSVLFDVFGETSAAEIRSLSVFGSLSRLTLGAQSLDDSKLAAVSILPRLTVLDVSYACIGRAQVPRLVSRFDGIQTLVLPATLCNSLSATPPNVVYSASRD